MATANEEKEKARQGKNQGEHSLDQTMKDEKT